MCTVTNNTTCTTPCNTTCTTKCNITCYTHVPPADDFTQCFCFVLSVTFLDPNPDLPVASGPARSLLCSHQLNIPSLPITNIWPSVIWLPTKSFPLLTSSEKCGCWWPFFLSPVHHSVNAPVKSLWDWRSQRGRPASRSWALCDDSAIKHQRDGNTGCTSCPGQTNTHWGFSATVKVKVTLKVSLKVRQELPLFTNSTCNLSLNMFCCIQHQICSRCVGALCRFAPECTSPMRHSGATSADCCGCGGGQTDWPLSDFSDLSPTSQWPRRDLSDLSPTSQRPLRGTRSLCNFQPLVYHKVVLSARTRLVQGHSLELESRLTRKSTTSTDSFSALCWWITSLSNPPIFLW